jgi:hypothetical protein
LNNQYLDERTTRDIDQRISRVQNDLGYSGGKIELLEVRELLRLDLKYYQIDDPSLLQEVVHKVKIGAKQIIERPTLLLEAVRKFDLSALFIPDRKKIYIDAKVPELKKRWYESHEIAHSLIPWHADYALGDDRATLSQACHQIIEAEANYGAGRLLYPAKEFAEVSRGSELSLASVRQVAKHFGNTITSSLWRNIEHTDEIAFAVVGAHPRHPSDGKSIAEYFIRSKEFAKRFSNITDQDVAVWIKTICGFRKTGPLGNSEIILPDLNSERHVFSIEVFGNGYDVLSLARIKKKYNDKIFVS